MKHVIELEQVSWSREGKAILKQINWKVKSGEHWAVLGLNGSGKTTLLNMLNGYIWPSQGAISVLGQRFGTVDIRELRKMIGWVSSSFQERIRPNDSAQEVVISGKYASIGLFVQPTEADGEAAVQLMEELGCGHLVDRKYQTCSQGEKQKLLIARALMAKPKLLILDEPCTGLDFLSRENLLSSIHTLTTKKDIPTMIYVTHHTEEILPVFSHTLLLRQGQIFGQGETGQVLHSETMSSFFETKVKVDWREGRAYLFTEHHV